MNGNMAERYVAFDFFQGHALSQKRKCQIGLHQNFLAFDDDFTKDETRQRRWRAFIKKKKALVKVEFEETMQLLKELLLPIVDSIHNDNSFEHTWSKETKSWM